VIFADLPRERRNSTLTHHPVPTAKIIANLLIVKRFMQSALNWAARAIIRGSEKTVKRFF